MHYIISLLNTLPHHKYLSLWGKGGHCFSKESAKVYDKPVIIRSCPDAVLEVVISEAEKLMIETSFNFRRIKVIPNSQVIWDKLGVRMSEEGLVKVNRD